MKWILLIILLVCASTLAAPPILDGVGVEQRIGKSISLSLAFRDEQGRPITLADCVRDRPVLLAPVYYRCPGLCSMTLNQLTRSLNALTESVGDDFDIIAVSFDPNESALLAAEKKQNYLSLYRRPGAVQHWHFLTGDSGDIRQLMREIGFAYRWDEQNQVFAHSAVVVVLSPTGKISRYFLGVDYPPTELRDALHAAASESTGPPAQQVFLYCFNYDPATGKYGLIIWRAVQVVGIGTLIGLISLVAFMQHRGRTRG